MLLILIGVVLAAATGPERTSDSTWRSVGAVAAFWSVCGLIPAIAALVALAVFRGDRSLWLAVSVLPVLVGIAVVGVLLVVDPPSRGIVFFLFFMTVPFVVAWTWLSRNRSSESVAVDSQTASPSSLGVHDHVVEDTSGGYAILAGGLEGTSSAVFLLVLLSLVVGWVGFNSDSCNVTADYPTTDGFEMLSGTEVEVNETVCSNDPLQGCSTGSYVYVIPRQYTVYGLLSLALLGATMGFLRERRGYRWRTVIGLYGVVGFLVYGLAMEVLINGSWKGGVPESTVGPEAGPFIAAAAFGFAAATNFTLPVFLSRWAIRRSSRRAIVEAVGFVVFLVPATVVVIILGVIWTIAILLAFWVMWPLAVLAFAVPGVGCAFWALRGSHPLAIGVR